MSVAMADIADGKGPEDLQEMWNLLCREPVAFNANPNFLFRGKSGDDAYIVTDVEESDEESSMNRLTLIRPLLKAAWLLQPGCGLVKELQVRRGYPLHCIDTPGPGCCIWGMLMTVLRRPVDGCWVLHL